MPGCSPVSTMPAPISSSTFPSHHLPGLRQDSLVMQSCQRLSRAIRCLFFFFFFNIIIIIYLLFFVSSFHCDVTCLDFRLMQDPGAAWCQ